VLVFALSADIARKLGEQFASQSIKKTYLAVVRGHTKDAGKINYALKEKLDKIADKMSKLDKPAQEAVTHFKRLNKFELPFAVEISLMVMVSTILLYANNLILIN
jgi:tRNA pseudouridine65 synthase